MTSVLGNGRPTLTSIRDKGYGSRRELHRWQRDREQQDCQIHASRSTEGRPGGERAAGLEYINGMELAKKLGISRIHWGSRSRRGSCLSQRRAFPGCCCLNAKVSGSSCHFGPDSLVGGRTQLYEILRLAAEAGCSQRLPVGRASLTSSFSCDIRQHAAVRDFARR